MNPFKKGQTQQEPDEKLYVIYDTKSGSFTKPLFETNIHTLVRQLVNIFEQQYNDNIHYKNAEDFQIFSIGTYSQKDALLEAYQPKHEINMYEVKQLAAPQPQQELPIPPLGPQDTAGPALIST